MVLDGLDEREKKRRLRWFLVYTIVVWSVIIVSILQMGPPPEEASEIEKSLGIDWSTTDFRPPLLMVGALYYLFSAVPFFVVSKKKQEKTVGNEVDEYFDNKPLEPH